MRLTGLLFGLFFCVAQLGCGTSVPTQTPIELPTKTPLSVTEWKELPIPEKYDPVTFERLQLHDPALKAPAAWNKFMAEVIVPQRKLDIPQ